MTNKQELFQHAIYHMILCFSSRRISRLNLARIKLEGAIPDSKGYFANHEEKMDPKKFPV